MANVFYNPYASKDPIVWSLQNCFIRMTEPGQAAGEGQMGADDGVLAATQSVGIQFGRQLDKRYPLTTGSPITIIGVPQGSCTLQTIMGPNSNVEKFLSRFGSACKPFWLHVFTSNSNVVRDPSCDTSNNTPQKLIMKNCTGASLGFQLSVSNGILVAQGTFAIQFDVLDWSN